MQVRLFPDSQTVARQGATWVAATVRQTVAERGQFLWAISGGRTPWQMLGELSQESLPWEAVHIFQVDERVAPAGHADRNLTQLLESLSQTPIRPEQIHPLPVEAADLAAAATDYQNVLCHHAGTPPVLDLVHLGLGSDGHTASLVPGDAALDVAAAEVAVTGEYQGRRRMTLTFPLLNRARQILWLVTGDEKAAMLGRLLASDATIPAGRVRQTDALVLADAAAAAHVQGMF